MLVLIEALKARVLELVGLGVKLGKGLVAAVKALVVEFIAAVKGLVLGVVEAFLAELKK